MDDQKFKFQASQYRFPYHYLADLDDSGAVGIHKFMHWGLDYLTYMTFIADQVVSRLKPHSLLDIGCGDGRLLNMLHGKVPRLAGADLVEQSILFARAFNPGLELHLGDFWEVPGSFQALSMIEVLEHIPDADLPSFVEKAAGKLSRGGALLLSVPSTNLALNPKHYRHYDLPLLSQQLAPHFCIEQHWFLTRQGRFFELLQGMLQNTVGIVLSRKWRRLVWKLHRRYTYFAGPESGRHLVALTRLSGELAGGA